MQHHYIKERVKESNIEVTYIHTGEQKSDFFTKPLEKVSFQQLRYKIGVHNLKDFFEVIIPAIDIFLKRAISKLHLETAFFSSTPKLAFPLKDKTLSPTTYSFKSFLLEA